MSFLNIQGWTVPVTNATPKRRLMKTGGGRSTSFRGMSRDPRRGVRRMWDVTACFLDFDEGDALIHLIQGEGHLVHFKDGLEASTGLMPDPGHELIVVDPDASNSFGDLGAATVFQGVQGQCFLTYDAQLADDCWTLVWWDVQGGWVPMTKRSDGAGWRAGVRDDTAGSPGGSSDFFVEVQGGKVCWIIDNPSGGQVVDDFTMLPWVAPESMILDWHAMSNPFGPFPVLRVEGDIIEEDFAFCVGEVTGVDFIQKSTQVPGIGWVNNAKVVKFALMEVPEGFVRDADIPGRDESIPTQGTVTPVDAP